MAFIDTIISHLPCSSYGPRQLICMMPSGSTPRRPTGPSRKAINRLTVESFSRRSSVPPTGVSDTNADISSLHLLFISISLVSAHLLFRFLFIRCHIFSTLLFPSYQLSFLNYIFFSLLLLGPSVEHIHQL